MNAEHRIKLAEVMGWTNTRMKYVKMTGKSYPFGCPPANQYSDGKVDPAIREQVPNPGADANDAESLMLFLARHGSGHQVHITVSLPSIGCFVQIISAAAGKVAETQGNDWKDCLCRAAVQALGID